MSIRALPFDQPRLRLLLAVAFASGLTTSFAEAADVSTTPSAVAASPSDTARKDEAAQYVAPNPNLKAEGIPPIPAALAAKVAPYTEFRPTTAVSWHPVARELIVARRAG